MNCWECESLFGAYLEAGLAEALAARLDEHMATCPACLASLEETRRLRERLLRDGRETFPTSIGIPVMDRIVRRQAQLLKKDHAMKQFAFRSAIAAALLVVAGVAISRPTLTTKVRADDLSVPRKNLEGVRSATWKTSVYKRFLSPDRRRNKWVRMRDQDHRYAFKAPGRYRREDLREDGQVGFISIEAIADRAKLDLNRGEKTATLAYLADPSYSPLGPFATFTEAMKSDQLQSLGTRDIGGRKVDGYRHAFFVEKVGQGWSYEFWLDPTTKRLVTGRVPGGDIMDPADLVSGMACDAVAESIDLGGETFTIAPELGMSGSGSIVHDIVEGPELDDTLFSPEPPQGYALKTIPLPEIREQDVTEFLGIVAAYFDGKFPDRMPYFHSGLEEYKRFEIIEYDVIKGKPRTPAETNMVRAMQRWWNTGIPGPGPLHMFLLRKIDAGSWKYVGKGVKLGDKDRIVCWYRLKDARDFRVVRGDLSVEDVAPEGLPLPVER